MGVERTEWRDAEREDMKIRAAHPIGLPIVPNFFRAVGAVAVVPARDDDRETVPEVEDGGEARDAGRIAMVAAFGYIHLLVRGTHDGGPIFPAMSDLDKVKTEEDPVMAAREKF